MIDACYRARSLKKERPDTCAPGNYGVFGDDIIVQTSSASDMFRLLRLSGFTVNQSKTFVKGPFRESCGADFHEGVNIRGVYLKNLDTAPLRYAAINQLNLFSTRTGIPTKALSRLLTQSVKWRAVPRWENDDAGIKVPLSLVHPKTDKNGSFIYKGLVPIGLRIRIGTKEIFSPRRKLIYNASGLLIAYLAGTIQSCEIGVRHDSVSYRQRLRVAPSWDSTPCSHPLEGWFNWQRWETAVWFNLLG